MKLIRFELTDDLIDICLDNVFKAVFTRDTPASRGARFRRFYLPSLAGTCWL
jgi:hypothetical protein